MKKIAVLSDIHSNYYLLKKVLTELSNENIDEYIVCGDAITDGADDNLVLDTLKGLNATFIAGNRELSILNDNETWQDLNQWKSMVYSYNHLSPENKEFVSHLPIYKIITIENKKICISHGSPYDVRHLTNAKECDLFSKLIADFNCDIYLFGHTHIPFCIEYKNRYFVNSGSISNPSGRQSSSYFIITINKHDIKCEEKRYHYNFNELKDYYIKKDYHKLCKEWSNLLLAINKTGVDHCSNFIDYLSEHNNHDKKTTSEIWPQAFAEYMKLNNLEIYE